MTCVVSDNLLKLKITRPELQKTFKHGFFIKKNQDCQYISYLNKQSLRPTLVKGLRAITNSISALQNVKC